MELELCCATFFTNIHTFYNHLFKIHFQTRSIFGGILSATGCRYVGTRSSWGGQHQWCLRLKPIGGFG
jgi:hypothetical protein